MRRPSAPRAPKIGGSIAQLVLKVPSEAGLDVPHLLGSRWPLRISIQLCGARPISCSRPAAGVSSSERRTPHCCSRQRILTTCRLTNRHSRAPYPDPSEEPLRGSHSELLFRKPDPRSGTVSSLLELVRGANTEPVVVLTPPALRAQSQSSLEDFSRSPRPFAKPRENRAALPFRVLTCIPFMLASPWSS